MPVQCHSKVGFQAPAGRRRPAAEIKEAGCAECIILEIVRSHNWAGEHICVAKTSANTKQCRFYYAFKSHWERKRIHHLYLAAVAVATRQDPLSSVQSIFQRDGHCITTHCRCSILSKSALHYLLPRSPGSCTRIRRVRRFFRRSSPSVHLPDWHVKKGKEGGSRTECANIHSKAGEAGRDKTS